MKHFVAILIVLALVYVAHAICPHVQYATGTKFSTLALADGTVITVPEGQTYLYDLATSPNLGGVKVFGRLVFDDVANVAIQSKMITVYNGGEFIIGSCDCPYSHIASITLTGPSSSESPDGVGTKVIGVVSGGRLDFHGEVRGPTWTRLASTAAKGALSFTLVEPAEWKVGDRVALAPTDFPQYQSTEKPLEWKDGSDERTITAVSADKKTFTVDTPLTYEHYSGIHYEVNEQGEVGLLTRNIRVQGDASSETSFFGGHVMVLAGGRAMLRGVEVSRSGQRKHLGRYPIHFHRMGQAGDSAVIDCSIHHNYQRAITVHGSHGLLIHRNVAFRTYGHMFFLEDGIETGNTFSYNLGMLVYKIPKADMLPGITSDNQPAIMWITNPNNTFVHNSWVGSPHHCAWIAAPINPMGPSFTRDIIPRWTPLGKFAHNTMHSCSADGFHVDRGPNQAGGDDSAEIRNYVSTDSTGAVRTISINANYNPLADPRAVVVQNYDRYQSTPRVEAKFEATTIWKCRGRAVWVRGGKLTFSHAKFADCSIGITFATGGSSYGLLVDSIIVGQTPNYGAVTSYEEGIGAYDLIDGRTSPPFRSVASNWPPIADIPAGHQIGPYHPLRGYEFYDGPNEIRNVKFFNFKDNSRRKASAISMLRDDQFHIQQRNRARQVSVTDGSRKYYFPDLSHDGDKMAVFLDFDGSVTGRKPTSTDVLAAVKRSHPFYLTSGCIDEHATNGVYICPNHFAEFQIGWNSVVYKDVTTIEGHVKITRTDKTSAPLFLCGGACNGGTAVKESMTQQDGAFGTLMLWRDYYVHLNTESMPTSLNVRLGAVRHAINKDNNAPYNEVRLAICYPPGTTINSVTYNYKSNAAPATSVAAMKSAPYSYSWSARGTSLWYHDTTTGYVWVRLIPQESQVDDPDNSGSYSYVVISANPGTGAPNCAMPQVATVSDYRPLPPVAAAPTPPAFSPEPPAWPRSDEPVCQGASPSPAPINCEWSSWTTWGTCSKTCGTGSQTRTRTVETQAQYGGTACSGSTTETQNCNTDPCPINCEWTAWSTWGACTKTCGTGSQTRTRTVKTEAQYGGTACTGLSTETQNCNTHACAVDCEWSAWTAWTACTRECGSGEQTRSRTIKTNAANGGLECTGNSAEMQACNTENCPVHCEWNTWSAWTSCSATCGGGDTSRTRTVRVPAQYGGNPCTGVATESTTCNTHACPVDCEWGAWSTWGTCTQNCGGGKQTRTRVVTVEAANGGSVCSGLGTEEQDCNTAACVASTVDCTWNDWSEWSVCSVDCDGGISGRTRSQNAAQNGGAVCEGSADQERDCNTHGCAVACEVGEWAAWSQCTNDCGGGTQERERQVLTASANNGTACPDLLASQPCNTQSCPEIGEPVDCEVSIWSVWSACSALCGGGESMRSRTVTVSRSMGGAECPSPLHETRYCNIGLCESASPSNVIEENVEEPVDAQKTFTEEHSGLPLWAWVLIALGIAGVVAGAIAATVILVKKAQGKDPYAFEMY